MEHLLHTRLCAASENQSNSGAVRELLDETVYELEQALDIIQKVDSTEARVFMARHSVPTQMLDAAAAQQMKAFITGDQVSRAD